MLIAEPMVGRLFAQHGTAENVLAALETDAAMAADAVLRRTALQVVLARGVSAPPR